MTTERRWSIPPSTIRWLASTPRDAPVAVLVRHSVRGHLPPGAAGNLVPLTDEGIRLAEDLGRQLGTSLRSLHTSPILRCVQTAEAIRAGAAATLGITADWLLGDPGVYVRVPKVAGQLWAERGHKWVIDHLVSSNKVLPGMASPGRAARRLAQHMLAATDQVPGLHFFVTHDSLVTVTVARLINVPLSEGEWPAYLEGAFFWRTEGALQIAYREGLRRVG